VVVAELHGDHAGEIEALLATGKPAAKQEILDVRRVELGHLGQRRSDHLAGQVIGTDGGERSLERPADR